MGSVRAVVMLSCLAIAACDHVFSRGEIGGSGVAGDIKTIWDYDSASKGGRATPGTAPPPSAAARPAANDVDASPAEQRKARLEARREAQVTRKASVPASQPSATVEALIVQVSQLNAGQVSHVHALEQEITALKSKMAKGQASMAEKKALSAREKKHISNANKEYKRVRAALKKEAELRNIKNKHNLPPDLSKALRVIQDYKRNIDINQNLIRKMS